MIKLPFFKFAAILLFCLTSCSSPKQSAQATMQVQRVNVDSLTIYEMNEVDQKPEVKGGMLSLFSGFAYPEAARKDQAEGRVLVEIIVTKAGEGLNHRVLHSVHPSLDSAALKLARKASFLPGMNDGEAVNVRYILPISFTLN
jgi:TonB family protein